MFFEVVRLKNNAFKTVLIGVIVVSLTVLTLGSLSGRTRSYFESIFHDTVASIEYYVVKKPISMVTAAISEVNAIRSVYDENKLLQEKLNSYASVEANTDVLSNELNQLKKQLNIENLPSEYQVKAFSLVTRSFDKWDDEITINGGENNGLVKNMVVVNNKGMIGVITSTTPITSNVMLLTSGNYLNDIPVMFTVEDGTTCFGLIEGYDDENEALIVNILTNVAVIQPDIKVYTSGLGGTGQAPKGIFVGTTVKLHDYGDNTKKYLLVKIAADMNDLEYISVVQQS